ncbi:hypothetical protein C9374_001530 [Naegleria lovaniensis]|uniref:Uncharacterized protein n=1 Tax=Naegleria lovaniensis TaxID=51637 RepID=A0AA88GVR0_NAELO|nr:uncharacterized protein C9374_001530 [Naegleria lovaniensis]KAG2387198.1 hypothetical protein C9374_001530 [Naegleria lovaniensis]
MHGLQVSSHHHHATTLGTHPFEENISSKQEEEEETFIYSHLPSEIIRHILSFVSLVFPNDFLSKEMMQWLDRTMSTCCSSCPRNTEDETFHHDELFTQTLEIEMKSLLRINNYFGRFKSCHLPHVEKDDDSEWNNSAFLVFPSLIFNANLTFWKHPILLSSSTTSILSSSSDMNYSMIFFPRVLSCFHTLIFHTAIPFEDVLIQFDEDSDMAFQMWHDMMWKASCEHYDLNSLFLHKEIESTRRYSPKLRLKLHFTNKYLQRSVMDHVLEKLLDSSRNQFLLSNGCLLKSLKLPTCSRFREGMIEEYRNYFLDTVDEEDSRDALMSGRRIFFIDLLNTFVGLETLKIDKIVDDADIESGLHSETSRSTQVLSHESIRMTQYFKMYPFKSNREISEIRLVLTEDEQEMKRQEQELKQERREMVLQKLQLDRKKSYQLHTCLCDGLKDHEISQLLQNYSCQSSLKTLLMTHTLLDGHLAELFSHSSIETLYLNDCLFEGSKFLEEILLHSHVKVLSLQNVTFRKTTTSSQGQVISKVSSPKTQTIFSEQEGELFKKNKTLVRLEIHSCPSLFDSRFMEQLSENSNIRFLTIRNCKLSDDKLRPILRNNKNIEELDICNNKGGSLTLARLIAFHCYRDAQRMKIISDYLL